jgi:ketosteroid isomerase-like protein
MKAAFDRITDAYAAFNRRDIDRALTVMHGDVEWENGMGVVCTRARCRAKLLDAAVAGA